jgi:hypothetical protein
VFQRVWTDSITERVNDFSLLSKFRVTDSRVRPEFLLSKGNHMAFLIPKLSKQKQQELLRDLNYLNTAEIKSFCKRHSIPYTIAWETQHGGRRKTKDEDRKGVMLRRVRHFLQTGAVLRQTCFPSTVVRFGAIPRKLTADDRLFYGQYDKSNQRLIALLRELTGDAFRDGAISRILARTFWSRGHAPTFEQFAAAWLRARTEHKRPNPEWAFLADRAEKGAVADWKEMRRRKANGTMDLLNKIRPKKSPVRTARTSVRGRVTR